MPKKKKNKQKPVFVEEDLSQGTAAREEERAAVEVLENPATDHPSLFRRREKRTLNTKQESLAAVSIKLLEKELRRRSGESPYLCGCRGFDKNFISLSGIDNATKEALCKSIAEFESGKKGRHC
jgi:hypothetical protein